MTVALLLLLRITSIRKFYSVEIWIIFGNLRNSPSINKAYRVSSCLGISAPQVLGADSISVRRRFKNNSDLCSEIAQ